MLLDDIPFYRSRDKSEASFKLEKQQWERLFRFLQERFNTTKLELEIMVKDMQGFICASYGGEEEDLEVEEEEFMPRMVATFQRRMESFQKSFGLARITRTVNYIQSAVFWSSSDGDEGKIREKPIAERESV